MRFERIETYPIHELDLDEGNYRFASANDQLDCIHKMYAMNNVYFSNLVQSLAEDDLGEPLLVYEDPDGTLIVMDGNRRAAALKVLDNPEIAPTNALKRKAEGLKPKSRADLQNVQAQVSSDKDSILRTVYERHASGKGRSRINWNALAAARFRYRNHMSEGSDWYATALLFRVEEDYPGISEFIDGNKYSHEVFRRIVRSAISKDVIPSSIFSDRDQRIKSTPKRVVQEAVSVAHAFLKSMKDGELNLSRRETYADKTKIDSYLENFDTIEPNGKHTKAIDGSNDDETKQEGVENSPETGPSTDTETGDGAASTESTSETNKKKPPAKPTRVDYSEAINSKLEEKGANKLRRLYYSMCSVSAEQHTMLVLVGAWTFMESLATLLGKTNGTDFKSFFNQKINDWYKDKSYKNDIRSALDWVHREGNCNKHSGKYYTGSATDLHNKFEVLEGFILDVIESLP